MNEILEPSAGTQHTQDWLNELRDQAQADEAALGDPDAAYDAWRDAQRDDA